MQPLPRTCHTGFSKPMTLLPDSVMLSGLGQLLVQLRRETGRTGARAQRCSKCSALGLEAQPDVHTQTVQCMHMLECVLCRRERPWVATMMSTKGPGSWGACPVQVLVAPDQHARMIGRNGLLLSLAPQATAGPALGSASQRMNGTTGIG